MIITIWIILQTPRLIAIPLINDILSWIDSPVWMYPAILDIVVAVIWPIVIYLLWKKKQISSWVIAIIYLSISIIDHGSAITASILAPTPQVFKEFGEAWIFVPLVQSIFDFIGIILLSNLTFRNQYLFKK